MINIPFNDWSCTQLKKGRKIATTRTKPYGKPGDTFEVDGLEYQLFGVQKIRLGEVASKFFEEEGCDSPEEFKKVWKEIHPKRGFIETDEVYLHKFRCLE